MEHTTDLLVDEDGQEFQFQVIKDRLKIRIHKERKYDSVSYDCFSMKNHGVMSFSKLYNSNGHFVKLTPAKVLEILQTMPENKATLELKEVAVFMRDKNKNEDEDK